MNDERSDRAARFAEIMGGAAEIDPEGAPLAGLPHARAIGIRLHAASGGKALLSIPYDPALVGDPETGVIHGGAITTLLDTGCGVAVMAARARLLSTATLDLRIDYMRPATKGLAVWARAECYRLTRSIGFARASAFHESPDDPVATATGAFILERGAETPRRAG